MTNPFYRPYDIYGRTIAVGDTVKAAVNWHNLDGRDWPRYQILSEVENDPSITADPRFSNAYWAAPLEGGEPALLLAVDCVVIVVPSESQLSLF